MPVPGEAKKYWEEAAARDNLLGRLSRRKDKKKLPKMRVFAWHLEHWIDTYCRGDEPPPAA